MPGYLLDTNALSILAPPTAPRNATMSDGAAFRAWVREHDDELFLSTITLAEIQAGDIIYTAAGEWHWHGAAPAHFMTHLSITEAGPPGGQPEADWGEHVSDEEYPTG